MKELNVIGGGGTLITGVRENLTQIFELVLKVSRDLPGLQKRKGIQPE